MLLSQSKAADGCDRFIALDAWRGIAALMVALYRLDAQGWLYDVPFVRNAYLFVDFFFVLSGFVIAHAYSSRLGTGLSTLKFLVRRFGRVWPLHAALLIAFVGSELARGILSLAKSGGFDAFVGARAPLTILWDGLLVQALGITGPTGWNTPAWSISTEFWTYIVFGVLCLAGRRVVMFLTPIFIIGGITVVASQSTTGMDTTFDFGFARCLAGFFSGVLVNALWAWTKDYGKKFVDTRGFVEALVVLSAFAFVSFAGRAGMALFAPFIFMLVVYVFAFERGPISRMLSGRSGQAIGRWSYSIYMTALLVSLIFNKAAIAVFAKLGSSIARDKTVNGQTHALYDFGLPFANDIYAVVYLAAVLATSWLTYRLIEDPARKFFNGLSNRLFG
jgi:peptidoglycan/LPS O-acetylase OafA/YrhL